MSKSMRNVYFIIKEVCSVGLYSFSFADGRLASSLDRGMHKINHHITECSHPHFCILNSHCRTVYIYIHILPPRAAAWAKAEPKPAVINGSGPACRFRKPEPSKARPKLRLSGQAGPEHH